MKVVHREKQANYFNESSHQYKLSSIESPPAHTQFEQNELIRSMQLTENGQMRILDFGCGSGRITFALISKGHRVYAMDPSEESLRNLSKYASEKHIPSEMYVLTTTLEHQRPFNRIVGSDILHHVNIDEQLPILHNALEDNGTIAFSEPGAWNLAWYLFLLTNYSWDMEKGIIQMTIPRLTKALYNAGFHDISVEGLGLVPMPLLNLFPMLHHLNRLLSRLPILRYFSFRFLITANK